jgi:hypothetical protein
MYKEVKGFIKDVGNMAYLADAASQYHDTRASEHDYDSREIAGTNIKRTKQEPSCTNSWRKVAKLQSKTLIPSSMLSTLKNAR